MTSAAQADCAEGYYQIEQNSCCSDGSYNGCCGTNGYVSSSSCTGGDPDFQPWFGYCGGGGCYVIGCPADCQPDPAYNDCNGDHMGGATYDACGVCGGSGPDQHFTCSGFKPETKDALQAAVDLWVSSPESTEATYGHISDWDVSLITNMSYLFDDKTSFNDDLNNWDVSNVTDMQRLFRNCHEFNGDISNWDVSNVNHMAAMFERADQFTGDLSSWDVSSVTNMNATFYQAYAFNSDISNWNVSNVLYMSSMLRETNFDQDISSWDVSSASNISSIFHDTPFNQDISNWDVSNATNTANLFNGASNFDQDISSWDVSNVLYMANMFSNATNFNRDISNWDVSSALTMDGMFLNTTALSEENQCAIHSSFSSNENWSYDWTENQGCDGVCFSGLVDDDCGVCDGDNSTCTDECGVVNGDNSTCTDECGVVNGDNSTCADECGVANGDNSTCADECGIPNGENYCQNSVACDVGESSAIDTLPYSSSVVVTGLASDFSGYCGGEYSDYAYELTLDEPMVIDVSLEGTEALSYVDSELTIFSADDECMMTPIAQNDDFYGLDSAVIGLSLEAGTYYIVVAALCGGWGSDYYYDYYYGYSEEILISVSESAVSTASYIQPSIESMASALEQKSNNTKDATYTYIVPKTQSFELTPEVTTNDTRECSFVEGPDAGCDGVCFSEATLDECGECAGDNSTCTDECGVVNGDNSTCTDECGVVNGDNSTCADCAGTPNGDAELDECGVCNGNSSSYDDFDVTVIVIAVDAILEDAWSSDNLYCSDINNDGTLDIIDIVMMVEAILGSARMVDASEITLVKDNNALAFNADGFVGGIQLTLSHGDNFALELTASSMVSDYRTHGNSTTVIIAAPESGPLFTASSSFNVENVTAATSAGEIQVTMPMDFGLSTAYPNPFNPSTSFDLNMSSTEMVSVDVYNVMGQLVSTIHSGELTAGVHSFIWNGAEIASGAYFIKATTATSVATQKVMLMK